ncbi:transposase [Pseudoclavibacter helvolus]|uniref:Transposase n=1 Tax=Pseudoclavibacter helvolus TaxID=255205 RepID=A0A7W4YE85_9MICO|nr:transposase [Pseudoclavibacter helvolus]MBB2957274.1 transposase [Pseudoclavibacter helvolus]
MQQHRDSDLPGRGFDPSDPASVAARRAEILAMEEQAAAMIASATALQLRAHAAAYDFGHAFDVADGCAESAMHVRSIADDVALLVKVSSGVAQGQFVLETVGELDLSAFYAAHRADGRGGSVYDPAMMLGVLVYAYCTGERSSRRLERRCIEDVAYRVLTANQFPDHATLARFRRRHQAAISVLFSQVLGLCVRAGLVDTGVVSIDGTKIEANASYFANKSREELAAEILAEAEATDASEDAQLGDNRGGDLPKEWAGGGGRRERIREALNEIDGQRGRDYETRMKERAEKAAVTGKKPRGPEPSQTPARTASARKGNTTDPHSLVIARKASGVMQGYNAQAAATVQNIVLAAEVNWLFGHSVGVMG